MRKRKSSSSIDWAQYTFVLPYPLLKKFRKAIKARNDAASRVFTNAAQAYVDRADRLEKKQAEKEAEGGGDGDS